MAHQAVHGIFPDRRCSQHRHALGKAQRFAYQAAIHVPRGRVGAFNVSRVECQFSIDLLRITKDDPCFYLHNPPIVTLFD